MPKTRRHFARAILSRSGQRVTTSGLSLHLILYRTMLRVPGFHIPAVRPPDPDAATAPSWIPTIGTTGSMDRHRRGIRTSPQVQMLFVLFMVANPFSALADTRCPPENLVTCTLVIDEKDVGSVPDFLDQEVSVDQTVRFKVDSRRLNVPIKELTFTQHGGMNTMLTYCLGGNHCHGRYIDLTPLRKGQPVEIRITGSILHEDCRYNKTIRFHTRCPVNNPMSCTMVIDDKEVRSVPDQLEQEVGVHQTVRFKVDTLPHFPIKKLTFSQHGGKNMKLATCMGGHDCHGGPIDLTPLRKGRPVEIKINGRILHEDCRYHKVISLIRQKCPTEGLLNSTMVIDDAVFPAIPDFVEQEVDVNQLVGFEVHTASHVPIVELSITQHGGVNRGISRCRGGHFCFGGYFDLTPLRKGHPVEIRITGSILREECTYKKVISFRARCPTTDSVQCQGTVDGLVVPSTQDDQLQGVFANQNVTVECETSLDTEFAEVTITQRIQGGEEDKEMSHCEGGYYCSGGPVDLRLLCQGHGVVLEVTGRTLPGYCVFNKTLTLSAARAMLSDTEAADWCREPGEPTEATDQGDMMSLDGLDGKEQGGTSDAKKMASNLIVIMAVWLVAGMGKCDYDW